MKAGWRATGQQCSEFIGYAIEVAVIGSRAIAGASDCSHSVISSVATTARHARFGALERRLDDIRKRLAVED